MSTDRAAQRAKPMVERRPAPVTVQRSPAPVAQSAGAALHSRLGNQAAQALLARSIHVISPPSVQLAQARRLPANVSKPNDPAEREAEEAARRVVRMQEPPATKPAPPKAAGKGTVQRAEAPSAPPAAASAPPMGLAGGSPLPASVRGVMEPRFGASFANVRIHTGDAAARQSAALNANAFTYGQHIAFGRDKFQPQTAGGHELIAHELTHTIQQGAAVRRDVVQRSPQVDVTHQVTPHVQRDWFGIPSPREFFANKAAGIPGFTMLTVVIGFNPITNARVDRSPGNILKGAIELIPGGSYITDALGKHGVFDRVSAWAAVQFETIKSIGSAIWDTIETFIKDVGFKDLRDPGGAWERAKAIVTRPIDRVIAFATALKDGIVALIKDAILKPIAAFAQGTRGYPLLCAVMGKDPITDEPVSQDAESLLGAFMKFIGEDEIWETMQKAKAIPRAFTWFKGAIKDLKGFVSEIPGLFVQAFKSLDVADIILIPRAFAKLAGVFGGFAARFVTWGATTVWNLLEIVFDVVSPGALVYIKKTGAALKSILKNPLPFVGNLVKAAKLGFQNFGAHFLDHLKAGLIDWLTGSLPGIYIPKAFSLPEIAKFAFSVLGLTWANIRQKLVKATSETVVKALETGFDIVVTLVRDGPAAAWDKIKEQLANLKDMVIGGITDFVVDMVVKKAIPKLIAMFIPGAGFISAILSIYDTIMVFVDKIKQIVAVVTGFVDSIVAIAGGAIGAAAARVETALAGVLSLAINFLAGFAGLGKVADKVMGVINKIRAPIDKALDWLVGWIVKAAKGLIAKGKAAVGKLFSWAAVKSGFKDDQGRSHTVLVQTSAGTPRLAIASEEMPAEMFLKAYVKEKGPTFETKNAGKIKDVQTAIGAAQKAIGEIVAAQRKDPKDEATLLELQQALLKKNTAVAEALRLLVGKGTLSLEVRERYLLEGLTGTYGSMPKPKGDDFTADHQPQAAVLQAARDFGYFDKTGKLFKRAANRAKEGFAINLHKSRHEAGSTFGSKGKTTKAEFNTRVMTRAGKDPAQQRKIVVEELRVDLVRDAEAMNKVVAPTSAFWKDLKDEVPEGPKQKELIEEVSKRIVKGEAEIAKQDLDSLIG